MNDVNGAGTALSAARANRLKSRGDEFLRLTGLSARLIGGRRPWVLPLMTLVWPAFQALRLLVGWQESGFEAGAAQTVLIGLPMIVLAVALGVRIIADEIDRRTLEIAYTVPGGAHRVWLAKLAAAVGMLLLAEAMLAVVTFVFFVPVTLGALYGALQESVFYLVLAMGFAVLTRSEITGALATAAVLSFNGMITGFGGNQMRISPTFNPAVLRHNPASDVVLAYTVQNRIGMVLAIVALTALAFSRADRREKLLG